MYLGDLPFKLIISEEKGIQMNCCVESSINVHTGEKIDDFHGHVLP